MLERCVMLVWAMFMLTTKQVTADVYRRNKRLTFEAELFLNNDEIIMRIKTQIEPFEHRKFKISLLLGSARLWLISKQNQQLTYDCLYVDN
jgi:hypothetical protein